MQETVNEHAIKEAKEKKEQLHYHVTGFLPQEDMIKVFMQKTQILMLKKF